MSRNVNARELVQAWGRILAGYRPNISIEITRECPLRCPGCYAYGDNHLGGDVTLRGLADYKGDELVTRAVRPIPREWAQLPRLQLVVSIDGLQPEHDARRTPATYDRIVKHIEGHQITVHCTVTRQQVRRAGSLEEFLRTWDANPNTRLIWISLYTPQKGEISEERLTAADRATVIAELRRLMPRIGKLQMREEMLKVYANPPASPDQCVFAQTTECYSADLERHITPCQFGGNPDCSNCGCLASAGLEAIGRHRLRGGISVGRIFDASLRVGRAVERLRT